MAVIRIASEYLGNIIAARESELGSMVLWNDYFENNKGITSKDAYYQQVRSIYNRFPPDKHPFVGLDVIDASVRGNTAYLKFQKFKQPDSPIISIKLYWIGG
ncbi:MAG: hypothetical protein IT291_00760, partial [Deltaproteobacteria bacterium]|nr:hypothetical protein [Deltaproteobacteria bacterium]